MNKQELIEKVTADCGLSMANVKHITDLVFANIHDTIVAGDVVRISGFGTFRRVATQARVCRNPATGGTVEVPAGHKIKFKPAPALKG